MKKHHPGALPRRDFLKGILATGAVSIITPRRLLGAAGPAVKPSTSAKVRLACVGIGGRGAEDIRNLHATGLAEIVALCDTDMGARHTLPTLKLFPDVPRFQDFRLMFDKMAGQIDALCIATPDHSHFPIAILAMSFGKHVYVEKPLAHTFRQIELLMAAEKKYKVVTQMGNQGHSEASFFQFKAWTEAGIIKNVTRITAHMNDRRRWQDAETLRHYRKAYSKLTGFLPAQPIPATLDWNVWIATALDLQYNRGYTNGEWRSWYELGTGAFGDWGAHIVDTPHRFLDLGLPYEIDPVKNEGHNPFVFPQASTIAFRFPKRGDKPPCELTWYDGIDNPPPFPPEMPSTTNDGEPVRLSNGKFIYGEGLTFRGGSHGATLRILPPEKARAMAPQLPEVPKSPSDHFKNFLLACAGGEEARSPFSISGPLCQTLCIGIIAQRLNTKLAFDRATKQFTNNKTANQLLQGVPPRKEWEQFYKL